VVIISVITIISLISGSDWLLFSLTPDSIREVALVRSYEEETLIIEV
jgi:hypothetical protein